MSLPSPHDEPDDEPVGPAPSAADVHVVRGAPDEVELAALVAGLVATAHPDDEAPAPATEWASRRRILPRRPAPAPGPDSWRWSLHP